MFYAIVVAFMLGLLSILPPYFGFLYSSKVIKEIKTRGWKKGLTIFLISGVGVSLVFNVIPLILVFFAIYGTTIAIYFIMEKFEVEQWNLAFLSTLLTMVLLGIIYLLNRNFFILLQKEFTNQIILTMGKIDKSVPMEEILSISKSFFDSLLTYLAVFIFLSNIFTSYIIDKENSDKWEFSYIFLLAYIAAFIAIKYFKQESIYFTNIRESIKYFYIIYGLKESFVIIRKKTKMKFFSAGIVMLIYTIQPAILFIYGSLKSFKLFNKKEED